MLGLMASLPFEKYRDCVEGRETLVSENGEWNESEFLNGPAQREGSKIRSKDYKE